MYKFILLLLVVMTIACANKRMQSNGSTPVNEELSGRQWTLTEISGLTVDESLTQKAWFTIDTAEKRIFGNAGCNNFNGRLQMSGDGKMTVSEVIATKMACEHMSVEYALMGVLKKTAGFKQINDTLVFIDTGGTDLAKFVRRDGL